MPTILRAAPLLCLLGALLAGGAVGGQGAAQASSAAGAGQLTFSRDIAPLVLARCAGCHHPNGSAPFSLLTYDDVRTRAHTIVQVTKNRYMPPWKPEPGYGEFAGERRLTDDEIARIQQWVEGGMVEGERQDRAPAPHASSGWRLGEPDLVLTMDVPYLLRAGGDDVYRHFVIPIPVSERRYVSAWEFRPGNPRVVHHATLQIDPTGASRHLDEQYPGPGYEGLVAHSARAPDGYFLDWGPGHTPYEAPEGMAFPIGAQDDLVMMLHLRPSGREEEVRSSVGFYFSDEPPSRVPAMLRLTRQDVDIPAGATPHVITDSYTLPVDLELFTVQPHAHYLAREFTGYATLPDGSRIPLLYIRDWDFDWQDVFRYARPVFLPRGSTVTMEITYDNSAANPFNPHSPPRRVTYGQRTSDEMAELWFQVLPRSHEDRAVLTRDLGSKLLRQEITGYEMMLRADPDNAALHDDVALLYAHAGDLEGVVRHFAESVRVRPDSAAAHYNLGTALLNQGRGGEARDAFQRALAIDPRYANAHRHLGIILHLEGRFDDAARAYREALRLAPEDPVTHYNLGVLQHAQGRVDAAITHYRDALRIDGEYADAHSGLGMALRIQGLAGDAVVHFREALRIAPDLPDALTELAWVLATSPDASRRQPEEALGLAERGAARRRTVWALDVLAAASAANGRFEQATQAAEEALALATAAGDDRAAGQIRDRLQLYRRQMPFREAQ